MTSFETPKVALQLSGVNWLGWKGLRFTRSLEAFSGSFQVDLADRWSAGQKPLPVSGGMQCKLLCDGEVILTGFTDSDDKVKGQAGGQAEHSVSVSGRDKSGDMVDASALHGPAEWRGLTATQIVAELARPFGIGVSGSADAGAPFAVFKLEVGESAFDAASRALRLRSLLAQPDGVGNLVIETLGARISQTLLEEGGNIKRFSSRTNFEERFSEYIVLGQQQGSDEIFGEAAAAVRGRAVDQAVTRYRPLIIRGESQMDQAGAKRRAEWEKTVRAARSFSLTVILAGWRDRAGLLWRPNTLVPVRIPYLGLKRRLLISTVTLSQSPRDGSLASLLLKDENAFQTLPGGSGADAGARFEDIAQEKRDEAVKANMEMAKCH